ncbi:MAG: hypothetical protein Q8M76_15010 [Spirochaetaceae bacterium]|nr:hypothetical protein [Spirochaetaceae bacterium]
MPEAKKTDPKAPKFLELTITDADGAVWGKVIAPEKQFSSGSVGYYCNSKIENPASHERYQVGTNITLIGSKPDKA